MSNDMIANLASPSVCVIDDEEDEYKEILKALNEMHVSTVHLLGTVDSLPAQPFKRVRLVFLDLHLSATIGKDAAAYTANAFTRIVSPETAPVIVVIWSKYANEKVAVEGVPPDDQETEAQLFIRTLLEHEPRYNGRLIFVEMNKPKPEDWPDENWSELLKAEVNNTLQGQEAVNLLWSWESLVEDACAQVSQGLTAVAEVAIQGSTRDLKDGLKATMQRLAKAQSEGDFTAAAAPRYLLAVLSELLTDQLDNPAGIANVAAHGNWLVENPPGATGNGFAAHMNGLLLTSPASTDAGLYLPGTVFRVADSQKFQSSFGTSLDTFVSLCSKKQAGPVFEKWQQGAQPVLIELSPVCDAAQNHRINSFLIAGFVVPAAWKGDISSDYKQNTFGTLPTLKLRWSRPNFDAQDVVLMYCNRYKLTVPVNAAYDGIEPWFRLRELPTTLIRNAHAAHSARVGLVQVD